MKADPDAQLKLLDLQKLDAAADQLRHQRSNLLEDAEVAVLTGRRADVLGRSRDQQIVVDDLTAAQEKADADVEQVKARRKRDQDRMDQGLISNPKDLERMQHELVSLERRITSLEDAELEVMEALEEAQQVLEGLGIRAEDIDARLGELVTSRDEKQAALDASLAEVAAARGPAVEGMPADLLALYEKLREQKGIGAALLRGRQCNGCHMSIDASELSRIRSAAPDEVIRCEDCQRILVRTDESGL